MSSFAVNYTPLMTQFVVGETNLLRDNPIVLLDVGARDGIGREWQVLGDQVRVYAFEPDAEECQRLAASAPAHLTYVPRAIGRARGKQPLYRTVHPASTGLYQTRMEYFGRLLNRDNGVTVGESTVDLISLDDFAAENDVPSVDFIKLDVEGAELEILEGSTRLLQGNAPFGILSEVRFQEEINGSPPFSVLDVFMRRKGFRLYDLDARYQSRAALPYPGMGDFVRADGSSFFAQTSRGQLQDGDALYFRDLLLPANAPLIDTVPAIGILKTCIFMEIFSLNDCAAELILAARKRIDEIVDAGRLLDLLASGMCGTETTYADYVKRYFTKPNPTIDRPMFPRQPAGASAGIAQWLRRLFGAS